MQQNRDRRNNNMRRDGGRRDAGRRNFNDDHVNPNLFKESPEYYGKYLEHLKLANMWNNNGQYLMGSEDYRRAKCLERGNVKAYESFTPYEQLYMSTRKNKYSEYVKPESIVVDVSEETCPARKWPTIC